MIGFQFYTGKELESSDSERNLCNGFRGVSVYEAFWESQSRVMCFVLANVLSHFLLMWYLSRAAVYNPNSGDGSWLSAHNGPLSAVIAHILVHSQINVWVLMWSCKVTLFVLMYLPSKLPSAFGTHIDNTPMVYISYFYGPLAAVLFASDPVAAVFLGTYIFATEALAPTALVDFL